MGTLNVSEIQKRFEKEGTVIMTSEESLLSEADVDALEALTEQLPYEFIDVGDTDEPNWVDVGRFMTDVEHSEMVNRPLSDRALEILGKPEIMEAFRTILGEEKLYIRRMQVNKAKKGGFVGLHRDSDSNPDYLVAVVLQLGKDFSGGEFAVYGDHRPPRVIKPGYRSLVISRSDFPHEVREVKGGERIALVFFLSTNGGDNRRYSEATKH